MIISYQKAKFVVECSYSENALITNLPSKRYDRRRDMWVAQNLNRNCKFLLENLRQYLTDEALLVCEETVAKTRVSYLDFPINYVFKTQPFVKQKEALNHAYNLRRNAFFMRMGTGKTKTAIDLYTCRLLEGKVDVVLVVCPSNLKENWLREVGIHCPVEDMPVHVVEAGPRASKNAEIFASKHDTYYLVVGVESLSVGVSKGTAWEAVVSAIYNKKIGLIVDESHMCKGHDSTRSKNVKQLGSFAKYMSIMTGTPTTQGPVDLYMQFEILDPNILGFGDYYSFRNRYCVMGGYENKQIVTYQNVDELTELISPVVYQCDKDADMPPKTYTMISCEMSKEQKEAYKSIDQEMKLILPSNPTSADLAIFVEHAVTKYGILQQITGGFINYDDPEQPILKRDADGNETVKYKRKASVLVDPMVNPKIAEIIRIAREESERSIIIWAKYRKEIEMISGALRNEFGDDAVAEYHGGLDRNSRTESVDNFNGGHSRFFVSNQQSGGVGLNLVVSDLAIFYSNSFKLLDREQSEDRIHRIGQKSDNVLYIDLVCNNTKDGEVLEALEKKQDLATFIKNSLYAIQNDH